ncbi:MAG: hypothetical protein ISR63_05115 [Desulfobacterales bacterium]|nr:hypothetical protein [Deltaproteobacteria bacterium]MBL6971487.1 hypothetical protein [Desulfobacterales bacterium]
MNKLAKKDKDNLKGLILKVITSINFRILIDKEYPILLDKEDLTIVPAYKHPLWSETYTFIRKKLKWLEDVYEEKDLRSMMLKLVENTIYENVRDNLFKVLEEEPTKISEFRELQRKELGDDQEMKTWLICEIDFLEKKLQNAVTNNFIEELENPTEIFALLELPNVKLQKGNISISESLCLLTGMAETTSGFRTKKDGTYVLIKELGIPINSYKNRSPLVVKKVITELKVFLGLSVISNIFHIQERPYIEVESKDNQESKNELKKGSTVGLFISLSSIDSRGGFLRKTVENVAQEDEEVSELLERLSDPKAQEIFPPLDIMLVSKVSFSETYSNLVHSIHLSEYANRAVFELIEGKIRKPLPQFDKKKRPEELLDTKFEKIKKILNSTEDSAEKIKFASLWYLEGYCSESDTFKFINYTIALESLLGVKGDEGKPLTESLSNRCGYWIGKNLKEKEKIRKSFKRIYDVRSRIIHSGKTILSTEESESLDELKRITELILNKAIMTY